MAVELRKKKGGFLPCFYGRYYVQNGSKVINTGVKWEGTPPLSMKETGDELFERSRRKAEAVLNRYRDAARGRERGSSPTAMHWAKTDPAIARRTLPLERLIDTTEDIRYRRPRSRSWEQWQQSVITAFVRWGQAHGLETIRQIDRSIAQAYMAFLCEPDTKGRRRTAKTLRMMKTVLGMTLGRLLPENIENPFKHLIIESQDGDRTINRQPLDAGEIERLLEAAKSDPLAFDLIVTGLSTGLRRGDVCRLRWASVNLKQGMLHLVTSKTHAGLYLPILPRLKDVLERRRGTCRPDDIFVYPEAANLLLKNPGSITWRIKKVFTMAFVGLGCTNNLKKRSCRKLAEALDVVLRAVETAKMTHPKRRRMIGVLQYYAEGQPYRFMQEKLNVSRGTISNLLRDAETVSGIRFLPETFKGVRGITQAIKDVTQIPREVGVRRASKYDFHALRTTFVTQAINGGISIDKLRALTGHRTVDIVLKHYFKPKGTDVANDLERALPKVLTRSLPTEGSSLQQPETVSKIDHIFSVLQSCSRQDWEAIKTRIDATLCS